MQKSLNKTATQNKQKYLFPNLLFPSIYMGYLFLNMYKFYTMILIYGHEIINYRYFKE